MIENINCLYFKWIVASEGLSMFSMVSVPLYDTLGTEACTYIINQSKYWISTIQYTTS